MRSLKLSACLALAVLLLAATTNPAWAVTALSHDLSLTLDPDNHSLAATDILTLGEVDASRPVMMTLAKDASIKSVRVGRANAPHTFANGLLGVDLSGVRPDAKGQVLLAVEYQARFDKTAPDNPVSADDPSYGVIGTISKAGVFLLPDAGWYPRLPRSTPTFHLTVNAPKGMLAVSEGRVVRQEELSRGTVSEFKVDHPQEAISLVAGPFKVDKRAAGPVSLATYLFKDDQNMADEYLEAVAGYLDLYAGLLGPYPFDKFAVVENFFPTGYGFASYTLLGSKVLRLPFIIRTSLPHELVHSWFGNSVLVDYDHGNWAEGLTTYLSDYLLRERESGEEAREYRLQVLRNYATLVPEESERPASSFTSRYSPETQAVGYGKVMMTFHMARRLVGDEAFFKGLKDLASAMRFKQASWNDLANILGQAAATDLRPFFRMWIERPGAPRLALADVQVSQTEQGFEVTGVVQQASPTYELRLPLRVDGPGGSVDTLLEIKDERTPFVIRTSFNPAIIQADPDVHVFRRLWPEEVPPMVNSLRGSGSLTAVVSDTLPPQALEAARLLPMSLGRGSARVLSEAQALAEDQASSDILFLGLPKSPELRARIEAQTPKGLTVGDASFSLDGVDYTGDAALFTVFRAKASQDRVLALYHPLSAEAAQATVRKIQHYGRYGYLVFKDGEARIKGVWSYASPLVWRF